MLLIFGERVYYYRTIEKRGYYMDYVWLVLLFLLGIMMLIKPEFLWKIEHIFTVKNGEPTDLYMVLMRIGGVFFLIVSIIFVIYLSF